MDEDCIRRFTRIIVDLDQKLVGHRMLPDPPACVWLNGRDWKWLSEQEVYPDSFHMEGLGDNTQITYNGIPVRLW